MAPRFQGIFAPLTTPFKNENISIEKLKDNIHRYNTFELSGYVISGSSAESVYLTDREIEELVKSAKTAAASDKKLIVGTAKESTKMTMEFSNRIAALGVDATLVRTPGYFKALMTQEALKHHYLTLADNAKVPLIIYHIPRYTGVELTAELLAELSRHEKIAGIKDSSGNMTFCDRVMPLLDEHFDYLTGAGGMLLPALIMGASGGILALADVAPALCWRLYNLFLENRWTEAKKLQHDLVPLNQAITVEYGIPAIKYALDMIGFYGGPCRLPLMPLDGPAKEKTDSILTALGLKL
ncbi:MAG: dihydrodipicolinate synthase family protein [Candidatus Aminicenantes bacterium]|nr:dihydrodipicolinate synthase family protein [Candidatus Aminicenantes bacterium]